MRKIMSVFTMLAMVSVIASCSLLNKHDDRYLAYKKPKPLQMTAAFKDQSSPKMVVPPVAVSSPSASVSLIPPGSEIS